MKLKLKQAILLFIASLVLVMMACGSEAGPSGMPATETETPEIDVPVNVDFIFTNGSIITMDDANPLAEALAITGNKIVAVGANDEILRYRGDDTKVIDLEGRTLVPGFIDSHNHRLGDFNMVGYSNIEAVIPDTLAQGWTSLVELFVNQERLDTLRMLDQNGTLKFRVNAYLPANSPQGDRYGDWYSVYQPEQIYSPRVRIAGVKIFMDIHWGQDIHWTQEDLDAFILQTNQQGWQIAVHTVGSKSHEMILTAFEGASQGNSLASRRHRIEHVLSITPDQIERMKDLGLIASIQLNMPSELIGDPAFDRFVDRELVSSITPWRSLIESGVPIAGGSDWPGYFVVEPHGAPFGSPMRLIYQAVTKTGNLGTAPYPWMLDQTISAEQALRSLTIDGAYATFEEDVKGSLKTGKLADMVILSDNPLNVPTDQLINIEVLMTMIDGKVEYCAPGQEVLCPQMVSASPTTIAESFAGTWQGLDPDDGSQVTLTLTQTDNTLTGAFQDSYSGNSQKPGFQGNGSGTTTSATSAEMTFDLSRPDGATATVTFTLALSDEGNILTLIISGGNPIVLQRQ